MKSRNNNNYVYAWLTLANQKYTQCYNKIKDIKKEFLNMKGLFTKSLYHMKDLKALVFQ